MKIQWIAHVSKDDVDKIKYKNDMLHRTSVEVASKPPSYPVTGLDEGPQVVVLRNLFSS
jgi:hypothetical protein